MEKKTNGSYKLIKKTTALVGAALAALGIVKANTAQTAEIIDISANSNQISVSKKIKPMPVLKLNMHNLNNSLFIANHTSHRSHSSHSSHFSHRSGGNPR